MRNWERRDYHFAPEVRLLKRWAHWCLRQNDATIMRMCGLSIHGSPPNTMDSLYAMADRKEQAADIYKDEAAPAPDEDSPRIEEFMELLRSRLPGAYNALLLRHCRILHGEYIAVRSYAWMAKALYGCGRSQSHELLAKHTEMGYAALREYRLTT